MRCWEPAEFLKEFRSFKMDDNADNDESHREEDDNSRCPMADIMGQLDFQVGMTAGERC